MTILDHVRAELETQVPEDLSQFIAIRIAFQLKAPGHIVRFMRVARHRKPEEMLNLLRRSVSRSRKKSGLLIAEQLLILDTQLQ
jgi:hypothetical protein